MLSCWPCSNCIQHYQGHLTSLFISPVVKAFLVKKIHPVGCVPFRNENRKSAPKSEASVWRSELFQWKLKSVLAGNFGVSISSFEFSFPGFREHSYPVFQTSAQSFEVRGTHEPFWLQPTFHTFAKLHRDKSNNRKIIALFSRNVQNNIVSGWRQNFKLPACSWVENLAISQERHFLLQILCQVKINTKCWQQTFDSVSWRIAKLGGAFPGYGWCKKAWQW